jgi:hypothetical protein
MTKWTCVRSDELYHHGIKGQKWGVRRFQNKDGSLTPAGEKRYDNSKNKTNHRTKLEEKYRRQGLPKEEAERKASTRIKAEIFIGAMAAVTVASCIAYMRLKNRGSDKKAPTPNMNGIRKVYAWQKVNHAMNMMDKYRYDYEKYNKWERIYTENLNIIVKINKLTK